MANEGYLRRLAARANGLHVRETLLLHLLVHGVQLLLGLSLHTLVQRNIVSVGCTSHPPRDRTGRLQIQHIQHQEVVLGLHDRQDPLEGGVRLEGEVHGHHPAMHLCHHQLASRTHSGRRVGSRLSHVFSRHFFSQQTNSICLQTRNKRTDTTGRFGC